MTTHTITADSGCIATDLLPDNQGDREVYLREHNAANFVEVVETARRETIDTVVLTIKAFAGEPDVLYVALGYAYQRATERVLYVGSVIMTFQRGETQLSAVCRPAAE